MTTPSIHVDPERPRTDESFVVRVEGLDPGSTVQVVLHGESSAGRWSSEITAATDEDGVVDLGRDAPIAGSYTGVDPMGLVWSLTWAGTDPIARPDFRALDTMTLSVRDGDGTPIVERPLARASCFESVTMEPETEGGLHADYFRPVGAPIGTALVLGGSEGGRPTLIACALAARGIETLSLAYFREEGLPSQLLEIPLEYVEQALDRLRERSGRERVAIVGLSKGAELAALLASLRPEATSAVVLYAPSAVVFQGIDESGSFVPRSSWTRGGVAVPFVPLDLASVDFTTQPIVFLPSYENPLLALPAEDPARIPVEAIDAPLLVISGDDDQLWPSARMGRMLLERRAQRVGDEHLEYAAAGHAVFVPYWPTTGLDVGIALGGTPEGTAAATESSWARVVEFLSE